MAELINTNVFASDKKFVDFAGLDYFWEKAKAYIDGVDKTLSGDIATLKETVGDDNNGLVKDVKAIQDELNSLSGGAGSISTQINNALATLDVEDSAVVGQYVSSVSETDGKITVTRADLPVYEAVGSATQALADAKTYVDGKDTAMDTRVKVLEAIDHVQLAADASASAVATVLDGAPEKFDTLKEIAAWIAEADTAEDAASLVTRVSALEAIDHDAYVAADETVLSNAKAYADDLVMADGVAKFDAVGAAAQALADAKTYVDGKVDGKFDAVGSAAAAQAAAIAQAKADAAEALKAYYTKTEVDNLLATNTAADQAYAKQYTDELFGSFQFAQNSDIDALFA